MITHIFTRAISRAGAPCLKLHVFITVFWRPHLLAPKKTSGTWVSASRSPVAPWAHPRDDCICHKNTTEGRYLYIYISGTQMTLVLIGKALSWRVVSPQNRGHLGSRYHTSMDGSGVGRFQPHDWSKNMWVKILFIPTSGESQIRFETTKLSMLTKDQAGVWEKWWWNTYRIWTYWMGLDASKSNLNNQVGFPQGGPRADRHTWSDITSINGRK